MPDKNHGIIDWDGLGSMCAIREFYGGVHSPLHHEIPKSSVWRGERGWMEGWMDSWGLSGCLVVWLSGCLCMKFGYESYDDN
jgi:hypothetical protein